MTSVARFDVVVIGASLAGCTAAVLFARRGLRVALVERSPDPEAYKRACTHYIQASAAPTIERLGLTRAIERAGGVRNGIDVWTRYGWIRPPDDLRRGAPRGFNVTRRTLDPMLRRLAADTGGVEPLLGYTARGLVGDGAIAGVEVATAAGARSILRARLVVGADGRDSQVARLAGIRARVRPNARFAYFAYYERVPAPSDLRSRMWLLDPDVAYTFPNAAGLTVLACFPTRASLPAFRRDLEDSFTAMLERLPDGPPLGEARRVSPISGRIDMSNRARGPVVPGLALIGDAALSSDPVWGVGCGWAMQTAEMLVGSTAPGLLAGRDLSRSLRRYRMRHLAGPGAHDFFLADYSTGRPFSALERLVYSAAARDPRTASHIEAYGERRISPWRFAHPLSLARAARHR